MILNMNNGSGPVTVVDFTLSENIPVDSSEATGENVLTVENVFIQGDILHGFVIQQLDVASNYTQCVSHLYTELYNFETKVTRLRYVVFSPSGGLYTYNTESNPNSDAYVYDSASKTLKVATAHTDAIMRAGNYRLMIW